MDAGSMGTIVLLAAVGYGVFYLLMRRPCEPFNQEIMVPVDYNPNYHMSHLKFTAPVSPAWGDLPSLIHGGP